MFSLYIRFICLFISFGFLVNCGKIQKLDKSKVENMNLEISLDFEGYMHKAVFAGGCFWCMESALQKLPGVKKAISGYTGGEKAHPTYKAVASSQTKHIESVLVVYDSRKITYKELLETFWKSINPVQADGQFYDIGHQYTSVIFYLNSDQEKLATLSKEKLNSSKIFDKPIATDLRPVSIFYRAEEYHQDYYLKEPDHYYKYEKGSGRKKFSKEAWGSRSFPW